MLAGRFKTLALALLPAILGFIMLAMPVIAIIGAVILAVTAFRKLVDYISNSKLGKFFGMDKDKDKPDVSKDISQEQFDQNQMSMDETYLPDSVLPSSNGVNTTTGLVNDGPIVNTSGGNVIKPNNNFNVPFMDGSGNEQESPFFKSANNMTVSKDQLISDEGNIGKTENNVIAPTSNTQVTTNNSTSVIDISSKNSDNSFLNLDYHTA